MKTVGIIGGMGPESTVEYYRLIIAAYRAQKQDGSYPAILINSIDLKKMRDLIGANELAKVTEYLVVEVQRLAQAGYPSIHALFWPIEPDGDWGKDFVEFLEHHLGPR